MIANNRLEDFISQDQKNELHLISKFNTDVNEIFFADKIVIVEGATEKNAIPYFIELFLGEELYNCNYYILNANGKDLIPFFIRVCKFLGLNSFYVIYDNDLDPNKSEQALESAKTSTSKITELIDDPEKHTLELNFDFESVCNYPRTGGNSKKIKDALDWASNVTLEQIPEPFINLKLFLSPEEEVQDSTEEVSEGQTIVVDTVFEDDDLPF